MSTAGAGAGIEAMLARLNETLEGAGIYVAAEVRDGTLLLAGQVDSEDNRQAALDVAGALADANGLALDDTLDVLPEMPDGAFLGDEAGPTAGDAAGAFGYLDADIDNDAVLDPGMEVDPDFTGNVGTTDSQQAAAEAEPYFPPTDPVVRPSDDTSEELEIVGGFSATSMDDQGDQASFDDRPDDDIAQAVERELAEDAMTTDLTIAVDVRDGVVTLRGTVPSFDDAEAAEEVAARVGGVKEVLEELRVHGVASEIAEAEAGE